MPDPIKKTTAIFLAGDSTNLEDVVRKDKREAKDALPNNANVVEPDDFDSKDEFIGDAARAIRNHGHTGYLYFNQFGHAGSGPRLPLGRNIDDMTGKEFVKLFEDNVQSKNGVRPYTAIILGGCYTGGIGRLFLKSKKFQPDFFLGMSPSYSVSWVETVDSFYDATLADADRNGDKHLSLYERAVYYKNHSKNPLAVVFRRPGSKDVDFKGRVAPKPYFPKSVQRVKSHTKLIKLINELKFGEQAIVLVRGKNHNDTALVAKFKKQAKQGSGFYKFVIIDHNAQSEEYFDTKGRAKILAIGPDLAPRAGVRLDAKKSIEHQMPHIITNQDPLEVMAAWREKFQRFAQTSEIISYMLKNPNYSATQLIQHTIALLRHSSRSKQVRGLSMVEFLVKNSRYTYLAYQINGTVWNAIARIAHGLIRGGMTPPWKIYIPLMNTLNTLAKDSGKADALYQNLALIGLLRYPKKTLGLLEGHDVDLNTRNLDYIRNITMINRNRDVRIAVLDYLRVKSELSTSTLIKRLKVETDTKVLTTIVHYLRWRTSSESVKKLTGYITKLALRYEDKALKRAAKMFAGDVKDAFKEEKAQAERERKEEDAARRKREKPFLDGRFSFGCTGGPVLRLGRNFKTGGFTASIHASINKGLWLSKEQEYVMSTGIEMNLDPVMAHWSKGWFSFGYRTSLRLNLSKVTKEGDEDWRLFVGPGYAMRYSPLRDLKRLDHGISVSAGALIAYKGFIFANTATFMMGPEFRVTHFPERGETSFTLGMKFAWQFTRNPSKCKSFIRNGWRVTTCHN